MEFHSSNMNICMHQDCEAVVIRTKGIQPSNSDHHINCKTKSCKNIQKRGRRDDSHGGTKAWALVKP